MLVATQLIITQHVDEDLSLSVASYSRNTGLVTMLKCFTTNAD